MNLPTSRPSEKNWLVRSSTRILGPFTLEEVTSLLSSKQISIIDEIRQPQSRWSYVRENDMFMEIVKNIREEQDAAVENTMTQSAPSQTQTKTPAIQPMAQTAKNDEVEFEVFADDMTPTPVPSAVPQTMPTPVGMKDVTAPTERIPNSHHLPPSMIKNYGAPTDLRLKNQIQKTSSSWRGIVFGLTAIAIVAVAVTFLWNDSKKSLGYEELLNRAIRYKSLGLYDLSLQAYKRASAMKEPDADSQIQMAPVLISEDRQSLQGRRILERALTQEGRSREEQLDAYMGISVSYMMDGDLKEAENSLQKAIGRDPANFSALLNLAIVQMKKGNYLEAMRHFESIYRKNTKSVIALFGRAMSAVEYAKTVTDRSFLKPLITDLEVGTKATGHLRQELSLFIVYAHSLLGDVDGVNQAVVQFLDFESGIADRYTHPLFVDWRFTQWDYLEKYCSELYEKSIQTAEMKALRSICLMEINRDTDAQKILEEALTEVPKDPYVLAAQAGFLNRAKKYPEAMAILKMPELSSLKVKNQLMGDICIATQDVACAEKVFTQAYQINNKDVDALYGMAWIATKKKNRVAHDYIRAGLEAEPNYMPLLELRDRLESE